MKKILEIRDSEYLLFLFVLTNLRIEALLVFCIKKNLIILS